MSRRRSMHTGELLRHGLRDGAGHDAPDLTEPILVRVHARRPFIDADEQRRRMRLRRFAGLMVSAAVVAISVAVLSPGAYTSARDSIASGVKDLRSRWATPVQTPALASVAGDAAAAELPMSIVPTHEEQKVAAAFTERAITLARTVVSPTAGPGELGAGTVTDQMTKMLRDDEPGPAPGLR